jgi:SAM-dependent methyltransferase
MEPTNFRASVADFYDHWRVFGFKAFRGLCNCLKAACMDAAVRNWRDAGGAGRPAVLDLGCGRGGDLHKWTQYRPRSYQGLDFSETSVEEARRRHAALVSSGRSGLVANFACADLCESIPLPDASQDIVSSMFFMQYVFESESVAVHFFSELARVTKPGGVLAIVLPDGDRVAPLLAKTRFGHFWIRRLFRQRRRRRSPYGMAYSFGLGRDGCSEYLAPPRLLHQLLASVGFEELQDMPEYSRPAQVFLAAAITPSTEHLLREPCSDVDWLSLSFFRVCLARKKDEDGDVPAALRRRVQE